MPSSDKVSALAPLQPDAVSNETAKSSSWLARQAAESLAGRVVMSAYESLKTGGTVVCLSPWGDSSPLIIPSIRFRDLFIESIMAATGGAASVAAPALEPISGALGDTLASTIVSEATTTAADEMVEGPIEDAFPDYNVAQVAQNASVKTIRISLKYGHTMTEASVGFYRGSLHQDTSPNSLFGNIKDYLATQKGWFNPYLFASGRRPVIPRNMTPDVVFCHGPFESGDYDVGQTLVAECGMVVCFSKDWTRPSADVRRDGSDGEENGGAKSKLFGMLRGKGDDTTPAGDNSTDGTITTASEGEASPKTDKKAAKQAAKDAKQAEKEAKQAAKDEAKRAKKLEKASKSDAKKNKAAEEDASAAVAPPRHIAVMVLGLRPHRGNAWTTSARPAESILRYQLVAGLPTLVIPAKTGAPLLAWDALALGEVWKLKSDDATGLKVHGDRLFEFLEMCVDFGRVEAGSAKGSKGAKEAVRSELGMVLEGAASCGANKDVHKQMDGDRAGIVFWRIP